MGKVPAVAAFMRNMHSLSKRRRLFLVLSASLGMLCLPCFPGMAAIRLQLSAQGVQAYQAVKSADRFYSASVGYAGSTPEVVWAFRDLLVEKNADAAFKALLQDPQATLPGQLSGLCGLWFTDQTEFKKQVARYHAMKGKVGTMIGCIIGEDEIADLVVSKYPTPIRLNGPGDTLEAWWVRNPKGGYSDIAGGYWPSKLKGKPGAKRPAKP